MNDIIVDVIKDTVNQITVSQNDNLTKTYKLIVAKNNARYDLSNKKVRFAFLKNGTNLGDIVEELNISDPTNGVVDLPITSAITRENGVFTCGLAIFNDSGYMENTAFFNMFVKESLFEKISGGLIDEGVYGQILSLLEKGEKLQKELKDLVPRAEKIAEPLQKAVEDSEIKKPQLDASIESAKKFIENLDGSQNIPQIREDVTELQNKLKEKQNLTYTGNNIVCENTLGSRTSDMILKGKTLYKTNTGVYTDVWKEGYSLESCGEKENNRIIITSTNNKNNLSPDYKEYIKTIILPEGQNFKGLKTVQDIIKETEGKVQYIKNIEEVVLNGAENWLTSIDTNNTIKFILRNFAQSPNENDVSILANFPINIECYNNDIEGIFKTSDGFYLSVSKSKLETQDATGLKNFFKS